MSIKDRMNFDFSMTLPKVTAGVNVCIIDNVKRIVMFSDKQIIVNCGRKYASTEGLNLVIEELREERMYVTGEIRQICFFESL